MACQPKPSASSVKEKQREQPADVPRRPPLYPLEAIERFFWTLGYSLDLPEDSTKGHFFPALLRTALKVEVVERGRVTFSLTVIPQLSNLYNTLHGGAAAAAAAAVAQACVRTVAGDKEFFLGESAVSYLSAARLNVELEIEGRVVRQGRNVIVVSVELKIKKTQQLSGMARFTFYNMLLAKL